MLAVDSIDCHLTLSSANAIRVELTMGFNARLSVPHDERELGNIDNFC